MAAMTFEPRRDLVGYGPNPPDPRWPGGARLAVNFVINVEEGSERSFAEGDGRSESGLTEVSTSTVPEGVRDLAAESMFEYGARVGIWRLLRIFEQRQLPFTAFACALALERSPELAGALGELGHDICCHGWRWIEHWLLEEDEERRQIAQALGSLHRTQGERPLGWYCRYGPSVNTRRLLVEEGGFLYDSDAYADELPYWCRVEGKPHLIVPYSLTNNDAKFARGAFATADDYFTFMKDAFDLLYEEGADQAKMMSIGLHPRIIGHPARATGLIRFLDHVAARPQVWICRRLDIARHWHAHHPMASENGPR
jgi:putative urate catabolism protein